MILNYQHLRYFWMTAREGSLTKASERMRVSPSTVSVQIRTLEDALGAALFERRGRSLHLTDRGQVVKEYADEIFALGDELIDAARSATGVRHAYRLRVGVGNHLPKTVAWDLLSPALRVPDFPVHLIVREDRADQLVADLAVHHLDIVLTDRAVGLSSDVHAESVLLGDSPVALMAAPSLAAQVLGDFPQSLDGAPVLLPEVGSAIRGLLEDWFERQGVRPRVVGEFGDSALMKQFGQEGAGVFPAPAVIRHVIERAYSVVTVAQLEDARERLYAMVMPSKRQNPAVAAILEAAQDVRYHQSEE